MAAYAAAQKSVTSSAGSGEVAIRWVSRIPVRPDAVSVRHAARRLAVSAGDGGRGQRGRAGGQPII